jgi:hypothetical protein
MCEASQHDLIPKLIVFELQLARISLRSTRKRCNQACLLERFKGCDDAHNHTATFKHSTP